MMAHEVLLHRPCAMCAKLTGGLKMVTMQEVAGNVDQLMGVKAVWGRSSEPVMCFGSRGNAAARDPAHFTQARNTASKAINRPYMITVGGGEQVPDSLRGRGRLLGDARGPPRATPGGVSH